MDRLRRIAGALGHGAGTACVAGVELPQVRLEDDGCADLADLAVLQDEETRAAVAGDYRRAGFLRDLSEALLPKPRIAVEDCLPDSVEDQHSFFLRHGFIFVRDILPADKLKVAQAAWTRAQARAKQVWHSKKAAGMLDASQHLYYDIPNLLEEDDCFIDMVDSPAIVPLMSRITGSPNALDPASSVKAAGCKRPLPACVALFAVQPVS
eukprot:COSAG01_NODE_1835_length_9084_cov_87.179481_11_plen_209_part_00